MINALKTQKLNIRVANANERRNAVDNENKARSEIKKEGETKSIPLREKDKTHKEKNQLNDDDKIYDFTSDIKFFL